MTGPFSVLVLALSIQAPGPQEDATCGVGPQTIVGTSTSGIPQVGNLALISMEASVPRRPSPARGQTQFALNASIAVFQRSSDGSLKAVPSAINLSGGGGDVRRESAYFTVEIPIDPAERDSAIREFFGGLMRAAASSTDEFERSQAAKFTIMVNDPQLFAPMFRQHRIGRFHIECRVLDQGRLLGVRRTELEVVYKGRFFDQPEFRSK